MTQTRFHGLPKTQASIAHVAAEYALYEGLDEHICPATVAEGAGVPMEVFHSCFNSVEDAVLAFIVDGLHRTVDRVAAAPEELSFKEAFELLVIDDIRDGTAEVYSMPALVKVRQELEAVAPQGLIHAVDQVVSERTSELRQRAPHLSDFEFKSKWRLISAAAECALIEYSHSSDEPDPETGVAYVQAAFRMITD